MTNHCSCARKFRRIGCSISWATGIIAGLVKCLDRTCGYGEVEEDKESIFSFPYTFSETFELLQIWAWWVMEEKELGE